MEASFDWGYIVTNQLQGGAVDGKLPPLAGQAYGFDIAVSDWDLPESGEGAAERQSQLFWKDPGAVGTPDAHKYARFTDGYGGLTLGNPPATNGGLTQ